MVIAERIRERLEASGLSQSELARRLKITQGTIAKLASGGMRGSSHLHRIARELHTTPAYLTGETDDPSEGAQPAPTPESVAEQLDAALVPLLGHRWGMGGGRIDAGEATRGLVTFSKPWLRGRIEGRIEDVVLIEGVGDSMEPTIRNGDMLLVDQAQREPREDDDIFAITVGDVGKIKRLRRWKRGGGYDILSDNARVPPDSAADGEMAIVGRVIWIGRWR